MVYSSMFVLLSAFTLTTSLFADSSNHSNAVSNRANTAIANTSDQTPELFPKSYRCSIFKENDSELRFLTIPDHLGHLHYGAVLRVNTEVGGGQSSRIEVYEGRLASGRLTMTSRVGRFTTTLQLNVEEERLTGSYSLGGVEPLQRNVSCSLIVK